MNHIHGLAAGNGRGGNGRAPSPVGVNLVHSTFFFITLPTDGNGARTAVKTAGAAVARGFFNDFDATGGRDAQTLETIHLLVCDDPVACDEGIRSASYVAQVSAKYRARLDEVDQELRRRLGDVAHVRAIHGALQVPRYTSAELHERAYARAVCRQSGSAMPNVILLPMSKSAEWWSMTALERHQYVYPHTPPGAARAAKGHAMAAEEGVSTIFRRLYHNPDGYQRPAEYDFLTYFECEDRHLPVYDRIVAALRDERQNPEWRFVTEGPEWRGRRVLRW